MTDVVEGVVKFKQELQRAPALESKMLRGLDSWRSLLHRSGLIGQDSSRYNGKGYGNVSQRASQYGSGSFITSGTQTGGIKHLSPEHYTVVLSCFHEKNLVISRGPIEASSESMTHAVLYQRDPDINFIFHSHSPEIWEAHRYLNIPSTREEVEYGTPEMAREVLRLYDSEKIKDLGIFAMDGHKDGIMTFGKTAKEAGITMFKYFKDSLELRAF